MLILFSYEFLFAWDGGRRRFCPLLSKFRSFDPLPPPLPVVVELFLFVLYTGERRCWLFVELFDIVGIDAVLPPVIVVDEPLFSDRWSKPCDAKYEINKNKICFFLISYDLLLMMLMMMYD
jgi:hypothetical protein